MIDSTEPLLNINDYTHSKNERKLKQKAGTIVTKPFAFDLFHFKPKDLKAKKLENKFMFKIYLHLFCQIIFILLMIILSFKIKIINYILSTNKILFYTFLVITFIMFIYPLISDQILKKKPYNYLYLFIFTFSLSYILCKILIQINPSLVRVGAILLFFELIYLIIDAFISKKENLDIGNTTAFIGLCLLFIGSVLFFIEKISSLKLLLIIALILLFGIYLIYDMNMLYLDSRRIFEENDYVLGTIFLYIDMIQTFFELLGKFYNSCEPEKKPIKKNNEAKSMIYTGEEEYEEKYNPKNEDDEKNKDKENNTVVIKRTNSAKGFKIDPSKIINEAENENEDDKDNVDNSFKNNSDSKLEFENKDEENN